MKLFFYLFLFSKIYILCQNISNISYINNNETSINDAVYIIRNREGDLNLEFTNDFNFINNNKISLKPNFSINKDIENNNTNEDFYFIKYNPFNKIISSRNDSNNLIFEQDNMDRDFSLWKIIPEINEENKLVYYVQNKKTKKFWTLSTNTFRGWISLNEKNITDLDKNNEFIFSELYKEVEKKKSTLLDEEPIDVFIKYIDLTDKKLNRTGINQINKDLDNEELRYSVRSILKNIPWIRKIFILMPNEKVRFFKSKEEISEKIVYVKDKDLLGFDSASSSVFQYNLFKMKKFGLSENFILMDDDYFIAQPCSKNEFFYEENGKILPALVTSDYYEMQKENLLNRLSTNLVKKGCNDPHSVTGFNIQQSRTLIFMFDIMGNDDIRHGKKLIEPAFSHNAMPVKLSDIEEIYYYISNKYQYANTILNSLVRTNYDLQFQTLYLAYTKNKYDRKVSKISSSFYDLIQAKKIMANKAKLFVINTSSKKYYKFFYTRQRMILNIFFPDKTKYEIDGNEVKKEEEKKEKEKNSKLKDIYDQIIIFDKQMSVNIGKLQEKLDNLKSLNNPDNFEENKKKLNFQKQLIKGIDELKKTCERQNYLNLILILILLFIIVKRIYKCYIRKIYLKTNLNK